MTILHAKQTGLPADDGNTSHVQPSDWYADHVVKSIAQNVTTTAPTVSDDSDDGYQVGSIWVDTVGIRSYICLNASVGAAVWRTITSAADRPSTISIVQQVSDWFKNSATVTLPGTPTVGNKLIAISATRDTGSTYPSITGFLHTAEGTHASERPQAQIQYRDVVSGDTAAWSVNGNNHDTRLIILEVAGLAPGDAEAVGPSTNSSGTTYSAGAVAASALGIVVGSVGVAIDGDPGATANSGYTIAAQGIAYESVSPWGIALYRIIDNEGAGSYTAAATGGYSTPSTGIAAFFTGAS